MPHRPASVTQADIARALRAAAQAGPAWRVEIAPGGLIRLTRESAPPQPAAAEAPPLAPEPEIVL